MMDAVHRGYEKLFFYNAPRSRSKKIRRFDHIDVTREFEILTERREKAKYERIEELYEKHDEKQAKIQSVVIKDSNRAEHLATFSDGDEAEQIRRNEIAKQELVQDEILQEMRQERNELVEEFSKDSLSQKMLISGIHKVCVLGVIKYH